MLYSKKNTVHITFYNILCVFLFFMSLVVSEAQERVVHFPKDKSIGMLLILDMNDVDTSSYDDWQPLCEATGDVKVPQGKALRLDLDKNGGNNLSALSKLEPDDLVMLFCRGVEIQDEQFKFISNLTSLREIYLREAHILGTGFKYLKGLKSLKSLNLSSTDVGDNELAYLTDLPSLEYLNLHNTPTNDEGMVHIAKIKSLKELALSPGIGDEGLSYLKYLSR